MFSYLLDRCLVNVGHGGLLVAHLYSTKSVHSPVHHRPTSNVPKCYENDSCDYITWQWRSNSEIYLTCKLTAVFSCRNLQELFWYMLGHSLANVAPSSFLVTHQYSTINTLPCTPSDCHSCFEMLGERIARTQRGSGERTVRDTHNASTQQCCRIGTRSCCFGTCTLAVLPMLHMAVSWSHTYIQHN